MRNPKSSKSALVIVDMQHGLLNGPQPAFNGRNVLDRVCGLIDRARQAGVMIIFMQHYGPPGSPIAQGAPAWEFAEGLDVQDGDLRVQKTRPSVFYETDLAAQLLEADINHLIFAGMKSDYCIDTSCRVAFEQGLQVTLVADAHTTTDSAILSAEQIVAHHNLVLGNAFAHAVNAQEVSFGD